MPRPTSSTIGEVGRAVGRGRADCDEDDQGLIDGFRNVGGEVEPVFFHGLSSQAR